MKQLPCSKTADVVVQCLGNETLIYDLTTSIAYCLNQTLSIVYRACDSTISIEELKHESGLSDDLITLAIDELRKSNLLADDTSSVLPLTQLTRREIIKRTGLSTMMALPLISYLVAPTAALAQSAVNACVPAGAQATATASNTNGTGLLACLSLASQKCCSVPPFAFQSSGPNICDGFSCSCTFDCK